MASRGRRWCWWLAGVVSCGTATSVVLVASRGRRWCWWLAGSSVVVPGVGGVGGWPSSSGLSAAVWAVVTQPAVVSGSSAHPALAAPKLKWCGVVQGQDTGSGVNKVETTAGVWQQSVFTCSAADSFQHTQNHHAHA